MEQFPCLEGDLSLNHEQTQYVTDRNVKVFVAVKQTKIAKKKKIAAYNLILLHFYIFSYQLKNPLDQRPHTEYGSFQTFWKQLLLCYEKGE